MAQKVKFTQLCYTNKTMYALDDRGRVWFININSGAWELDDRRPDEPSTPNVPLPKRNPLKLGDLT